MLLNLPKFIKNFSYSHKDSLNLILSDSYLTFLTSLAYALIPIFLAGLYDELVAGIIIGFFSAFNAFFVNPIVGNLSDRFGSKYFILGYKCMVILSGIIWFIFPINTITMIFFILFLYMGFSFRINETYVLRVTDKKEGGLMFGISENIYSLGYFFGTMSIPFFAISGNYKIAAGLMIILGIFSLITTSFIKNDFVKRRKLKSKTHSEKSLLFCLNPINSIKNATHFIKKNNNYPLMILCSSAFQGIFYGTIWFVFPLYIVDNAIESIQSGMLLGIYEVATIFLAGLSGYLADKYNWRHIHSLGWFLIIIGVVLMPFFAWPASLILIGFVIGVGNNFAYFAAEHALEEFDVDHEEDGAFVSTCKTVADLGYTVSPIVAGFLYFKYGFTTSLLFSTIICVIIAVFMIVLTYKKREETIFID